MSGVVVDYTYYVAYSVVVDYTYCVRDRFYEALRLTKAGLSD